MRSVCASPSPSADTGRTQHGFGTYKYATGKTYTGMWQEDTPHGKGARAAPSQACGYGLGKPKDEGPLCM